MGRELGRSLNMAEGENLKLVCDAFGWPVPVISWVRLNPLTDFVQPLTVNVTLTDPRIVANGSLLTITPAGKPDYMVYACIAKNNVGFTNSTILVRVKGQWQMYLHKFGFITVITVFQRQQTKHERR